MKSREIFLKMKEKVFKEIKILLRTFWKKGFCEIKNSNGFQTLFHNFKTQSSQYFMRKLS